MTVKGGWAGIVSLDVLLNVNKAEDKSLNAATKMLEEEFAQFVKEAIEEKFDGFPDGGWVQISDICIEPFEIIKREGGSEIDN